MAASSISMLALLLLMSAVTPGLSTEGEGSQDHTATALIIAMREVSRALECFGDTVQGLRQQRQSSDALTDLHTLTATVLRVEERINQQDENIESLKEKIEDITKVEAFTQEIEDLKNQLQNKNQTVEALNQEIEDLKNELHNKNHTAGDLQRLLDDKTSENESNVDKLNCLRVNFEAKFRENEQNLDKVGDLQRLLDNKTSENERNVDKLDDLQEKFEAKSRESEQNLEKVQDLGRNLDESRRYAEKLEQLVQQLNNTLESKKKDVPECAEQPPQKIKNLVLQYSGSTDWQTLWKGLDAEMDHSSEAYGELKNMDQYSVQPHLDMGGYGYTQLSTLLLCAGMPVNMADKTKYTLLYGTAYRGRYDLAEMLLSRGADVNVRISFRLTPLMTAAANGYLEIVKLLVQAGADTTATDVNGDNVLYYAKIYNQTAVQQYLEQFPA